MNWTKKYKFSDLYNLDSGISSKPEQAGHGSPFLSFSTVFNNYFLPASLPDLMDTSEKERKKYSIKEGDIFLTRTSETLDELGMSSVAIKDYPDATYSGFLKRLRPKQTNVTYPKFMAFYLRSELFRKTMRNNAIMTLRASFNEQIFSYLDLLLPEYDEQVKIGDFLYSTIEKTEINNKINVELEAMAKLIYDYWFVQFDFPISTATAAAMGKPELEGKPYKASGGPMVYNKQLKREIPEGWEVKELDEIINIYDSKRVPLSKNQRDLRKGNIPYYGATEIMDYIDDFIFDDDYILIAEDGSVMNQDGFPVVQFIWGKTWVNNHAHVIQAKDKSQNEFLFQLVKRIPVVLIKTGSIQMKINQENLKKYKILAPSEELIIAFSDKASDFRKMLINNIEQNQKLSELRYWLLPMLMNGQVIIKEAEEYADSYLESMAAEPREGYGKK